MRMDSLRVITARKGLNKNDFEDSLDKIEEDVEDLDDVGATPTGLKSNSSNFNLASGLGSKRQSTVNLNSVANLNHKLKNALL